MLPKRKGKDDSIVINLEDFADGEGTHWVCCFGNEYFDSFGLPPPDVVVRWMKKNGDDVFYNSSKLQKDRSILCGYFCIYYIRERTKGRDALDVLLDFTQQPSSHNENLVV